MSIMTDDPPQTVALGEILPVYPTDALLDDFDAWMAATDCVTETIRAEVERA